MVRLLYQLSLGPGSRIFVLLNVLSCWSTYFSVEGISYTLALYRLWWVGVGYYLLLSFHCFLAMYVMMDTYAWWDYMHQVHLGTFLLISLLLHLVLLRLTFFFLIWYFDDHRRVAIMLWSRRFCLSSRFVQWCQIQLIVCFWVRVGIDQVFFVSVDEV